eukprot:TRINITY_DN48794_c0_g1_i1.p1 TRINITY_DN48794_c0_g1~~TRINITY_DN48794_c0_g1_i1.p1  ORF type:complete len:399 (-),score=66.70 TRINITY_DN48794_c0_g1_i1:87-1205(-)
MDCEEAQQASSEDETRVPPRQPSLSSRNSVGSSMSGEHVGQMHEQMQEAGSGVSRASSSTELMTISMVLERTSKQYRSPTIRRLPLSPQKPSLPGSPRSSPPSLPSSAPAPPELITVRLEYLADERPDQDILGLDGGKGSPVVISKLALGGKARKAGVRTGAIIQSINGVDTFQSLPRWEVLFLQAPLTLELKQLPAPSTNSPRCKEIRIVAKNSEPGMRLRQGPWGEEDRVSVVESKVFLPGRAALLLTSFPDEEEAENVEGAFDSWALRQVTPRGPTFYELRRVEAHDLVDEATKAAWNIATQNTKYVTQLGRRLSRRRRTDTPLCDKLWAALERELLRDQPAGEPDLACCIPVPDCKLTGLDTSQCQWV